MKEVDVLGGVKLPKEDYFIMVLLSGATIVCGDLEMTDLSKPNDSRNKIQVYKRRHVTKNEKGNSVTKEYNVIHYSYLDAVKDFLELKRKYYE